MKLIAKFYLSVKPDKNGEYPEQLAKTLIAAGLAVEDTNKQEKSKK